MKAISFIAYYLVGTVAFVLSTMLLIINIVAFIPKIIFGTIQTTTLLLQQIIKHHAESIFCKLLKGMRK